MRAWVSYSEFSFLFVLLSPTQLFGFTECFGVVLPSVSDSQENRGLGGFQQFLKSLQSGPSEGELGGWEREPDTGFVRAWA